ncbi:SEFIR domain protein [Necator americanus]|uniref:SEFIR domain protein n=1 Tax=Necator americanus TaxID=51031 RepID=W2TET4_NECAM|nr:SEFIR domain protein [Necator americanus]ETN79701.1 SEFIR domain protein [Necator americanus]
MSALCSYTAVFVLALFGMIYVFILRRRVRHTPVEVREIELQSKPSVLLLTPDDCDEHALVMLLLSRILERHFGVNVLLDYHEMSNSVARPSRWLVDSMCRASRVLIIVSPCTELVINGQHLKQRRPFPDLFGSAINMILRESTKTTTLSKYIICRLPYSPPTPKQLSLLGFPEVEVPSEFTRLTALVHSIDYEFNDAVDPSLQNELAEAVNRVVKMMKVNPSWIESRCVSENVHNDNTVRFVDVPEKSMLLETAEERREAAVEFGLLPPEENEVVGISSEFALLPPDSSDED